ncbi:MAG: hypothetical protein IPM23_01080 [Candidatus Melainabacteria bacterium]|nr:hypothetical protein [Candidatus Melainabacteria bacterium]
MAGQKFRHPVLAATGFFAWFDGPFGGVPVQLVGNLTTGEYVYFCARFDCARLEVHTSRSAWERDEKPLASYEQTFEIEDDIGVGMMEADQCVELILSWLSQYRSTRAA